MFAIVDIETTGGFAEKNGITEIAIIRHDGQQVIDEFSTLINPQIEIPPFIENYIGITNDMVAHAPTFDEVSEEVYERLKDCIFVAHNVNFDYSFVKHQLKQASFDLTSKKLCTVRLSRKLLPGLPSYSLGNLCASIGIPVQNRHRALGDASATVKVFEKILMQEDAEKTIAGFLKRGSKESALPPHLDKKEFEQLPSQPGVYYFYDETGKIIYVGKAVNIKKRVFSHFSGNTSTEKKQNFMREIKHVGFQETGSEFQAFILESIEIKKHWPKHNKALKSLEFSYAIYDYEDQNGYLRLAIDRARKHVTPLQTYQKLNDAFNHLQTLVFEFNLCPKLCLINSYKEPCAALIAGCCSGACELKETANEYNSRAHAAITELQKRESYAIIDKGINKEECCCILIDENKFYGMEYLPKETDFSDLDNLKQLIKPQKENYFIKELVKPERLDAFRIIKYTG